MHNRTEQLVSDLLGSAHVFLSAVSGVLEEKLLAETVGSQLTQSHVKILNLIELTDARSVGDVAAFLGVSDAAASKSVDRLVQRKYLRRVESRYDRRSSELSLTPAGRAVLAEYTKARHRALARVFRDFPAADLRSAAEILERLTKRIVTQTANPEEICLQCGIYLQKRCLVRDAAHADCSYQLRKHKRKVNSNGTDHKITARGRPRVGPPG